VEGETNAPRRQFAEPAQAQAQTELKQGSSYFSANLYCSPLVSGVF
jgi:hypothetical protein